MSERESANPAILLATTRQETALDVTAAVVNLVPLLGGPVATILGGLSQDRKFDRVREVILRVALELRAVQEELGSLSKASEEYVKSEDFQELLEDTLRRVSRERSGEKRRIYGGFLVDAIKSPGQAYDEQIRFLRSLEELQGDHIRVLRAVLLPPERNPETIIAGSRQSTLEKRLPDMSREHVADLWHQMEGLGMLGGVSLSGIVTGSSAQDLTVALTPYGRRFTAYLSA